MVKSQKSEIFGTQKTKGFSVDPICGMDVDPKKAESKGLVAEKKGKKYHFCSEKCKTDFAGKKWWQGNFIGIALSVVLVVVAAVVYVNGYMLPFMGIVFLLLAGLKLIDIKGFSMMFSQYDLIAKRSMVYAKVYPFIELLLGIAFLLKFQIKIAAVITVLVMGIGAIGVGKNLFSKNKIRCACLGAKIKVPLTGFTLVEDIVMVVMGLMVLVL